jgi:competence protein ComEC
VVSALFARRECPQALLVDRGDLTQKGAHAIWLDPDQVRIETVADWRGRRPWTAP